jgi:erythromycin esterase-like protein
VVLLFTLVKLLQKQTTHACVEIAIILKKWPNQTKMKALGRLSESLRARAQKPQDIENHDLVQAIQAAIQERAIPIRGARDLKPLIDQISQAKIVMLGEASHGTHEFYEYRRMIAEQLIENHGFNFISVEGDWPPCFELHRYVTGKSDKTSVREVLRSFDRWPTWMWANTDVIQLSEWMKTHNSRLPEDKRTGFYGLDVYSLFTSIDCVLAELEKTNPVQAKRARDHYECFDQFQRDERAYARSLIEFPEGCERGALETLQSLLKLRLDGQYDREEALFDAQQNARIVANAENYYRTMILGTEDSWNVRDEHMMETLDLLLKRHGPDAKGIVWAHNTHIGDYKATDMAEQGQVNIGGLARKEWGEKNVALVGFGTYKGEVIASHAWDGPIQKLPVPEARPGTYERIFHEVALAKREPNFFIPLDDQECKQGPMAKVLGHRAIGVVYHPEYERFGNYVPTSLARRYDAFLFVDQTTALEPLIQEFKPEEIPETFPRGE